MLWTISICIFQYRVAISHSVGLPLAILSMLSSWTLAWQDIILVTPILELTANYLRGRESPPVTFKLIPRFVRLGTMSTISPAYGQHDQIIQVLLSALDALRLVIILPIKDPLDGEVVVEPVSLSESGYGRPLSLVSSLPARHIMQCLDSTGEEKGSFDNASELQDRPFPSINIGELVLVGAEGMSLGSQYLLRGTRWPTRRGWEWVVTIDAPFQARFSVQLVR